MSEVDKRPDWIDDETILPPYPLLRCPRCKAIFSDHAIHICRDLNKATLSATERKSGG